MSLQHATTDLLDYSAKVLTGLVEHGSLSTSDLRFASAKMAEASTRLKVEPLTAEDIRESRAILHTAKDSLRRLLEQKPSGQDLGWLLCAIETWNASQDLYDGMTAFQAEVNPSAQGVLTMGECLRRLLPAGWWGSR